MIKRAPRIWRLIILAACLAGASGAPAQSAPIMTPDPLDNRIFLPIILRPTTYYVAPMGNDANPGTFNAPWRTLQKAADAASAGSTIYVRAGAYGGFRLTRSGLTFAGYSGETAVVMGDSSSASTIKILDLSDVAIRNLTVQDSVLPYGAGISVKNASNITIEGNVLRDNQGFGLVLENVTNAVVENNDITHNGTGIEVQYGSDLVVIHNNRIYQNDRMVDANRGALGINFYESTGPVIVSGNSLWGNHTLPGDPAGSDGAAFEIYAASNITMTDNVMWDNQTVVETGTQNGLPCDNLTFTRNVAYRVSDGTNKQMGLILRCAANSLIAHNVFDGLDMFAWDLSHNSGGFGGSVEGLRILNNIVVNGRAYSIDTALPASVIIDYNLAYGTSGALYGNFIAYVAGKGNTSDFATFQSWTGYEAHGLSADPRFVNPTARDYHLSAESPAIDRGIVLADPYNGMAPDLGRYEYP